MRECKDLLVVHLTTLDHEISCPVAGCLRLIILRGWVMQTKEAEKLWLCRFWTVLVQENQPMKTAAKNPFILPYFSLTH